MKELENIARAVKAACEMTEGSEHEASFYNGYSGRGMYGKQCVGVTGSERAVMAVIQEVIKEAHYDSAHDDTVDFELTVDTLLNYERDSMGMDIVVYWRELDKLEEEAEESDGQPDEAQEWHDFDPDC